MIAADAADRPGERNLIVMVGDIVDRGPRSAEVIDHLMTEPPPGFTRLIIAGNHEEEMLSFLDDPDHDQQWLAIGGLATLLSYGVQTSEQPPGRRARRRLALAASVAIPEEHIAFLRGLPIAIVAGKYLFVHAGVRPGVPFGRQTDRDLQEIREEFTTSSADHGFVVVHGHTPFAQPVHRANRISLDLAPYATGRIAAARIEGEDVRFLVAN